MMFDHGYHAFNASNFILSVLEFFCLFFGWVGVGVRVKGVAFF
jgi:hypothetical protein